MKLAGYIGQYVGEYKKIEGVECPGGKPRKKGEQAASREALLSVSRRAHADNPDRRRPRFRMASATRATFTISFTSCTRTMCAPPKMDAATAAAVPQMRSSSGAPPRAFPM